MWESLPSWLVWPYGLFILSTIGMAIWSISKKRMQDLAYPALAMAIITPIATIFYLIGRGAGVNEFEYIMQNVVKGDIMAIFIFALYGYLIFWWVVTAIKWKTSSPVNQNKEVG
ncbi:hypothetical protein [Oceanobacillus manasiensis]|uniref:hypothetical protein n=1 Tax=Oceanobacillus manasiensis TaxID=586413 RepID=UPI0005A77EAF|nr:hypothetical protein [Oceanobacillus manasiensis]